jgi:hypothetical protein
MKKKSKIILIVSAFFGFILYSLFLVSAATTTNYTTRIIDFFNNFNSGTQGFLLSLLPLAFLIVISIFLIKKGNRTLLAIEWLIWLLYAIFMLSKVFAFFNIYFGWNIIPINYSIQLINPPALLSKDAYFWFAISILINTIAALILSFKNNLLINIVYLFRRKSAPAPVDYQI